KTTLIQCAWSATRNKASYLQASSIGSARGAAQKRLSQPSPPQSSPPSITCSQTEPCTRISAPITSTAGAKPPKPNGPSQSSRTLATPSKSHRSQHDRDPVSF